MKQLTIVLLIFAPLCAHAQGVGLWTGVNVEKKLNKSFSANLNAETRFSQDITVLNSYLAEAGVEYKLNKYLKAEVNYRFTGRRKRDKTTADGYYYRPYHRFYGGATFDFKPVKWLRFAYRIRYQQNFKDDERGLVSDGDYLRHRFELAHKNKSRFSPYVSADVFNLVGGGLDQVRYKAGVEMDFNKRNTLDLALFSDKPSDEPKWQPVVISVAYKIKIK